MDSLINGVLPYPANQQRTDHNPLHVHVESRRQAEILQLERENPNSNFHCHIWIQREKFIQMSRSIGPLFSEGAL